MRRVKAAKGTVRVLRVKVATMATVPGVRDPKGKGIVRVRLVKAVKVTAPARLVKAATMATVPGVRDPKGRVPSACAS